MPRKCVEKDVGVAKWLRIKMLLWGQCEHCYVLLGFTGANPNVFYSCFSKAMVAVGSSDLNT